MPKILIIEDDNDINQLIERILKKEGYETKSAFSGTEGKLLISMEPVDLILCDLMLPGMSGESLITEIRKTSQVPIIVLTAKSGVDDKVNVLGSGADDYITKPFEPKELLARVKVQLRRLGVVKEAIKEEVRELRFGQLVMNLETMVVTLEEITLELTQREFLILRILMENPGKVFSKEALYEAVWKQGYYGEDNTISVHVSNIRKKMEKITEQDYIHTVWGIGYRLA